MSDSQLPSRPVRRQPNIVVQQAPRMNPRPEMRTAPDQSNTPKIFQILQLIWTAHQRWWKLTIPLGILAGVGIAGTIWSTRVPTYTASATLEIKDQTPYIVFEERGNAGRFVRTQLELFQTRAILSPALQDLGATVPKIHEMEDPIAWLQEGIQAGVVRDSDFVSIRFTDPDRETAEKVLEAVVQSYMKYHRRYERNYDQILVGMLQDEKERREKTLIELRNRVRDLAKKAGVAIGGAEPARAAYDSSSPLKAVHDLLIQTEVDLEVAKAELEVARRQRGNPTQEIPEYELKRLTESQPMALGLKQEIAELSAKLKAFEKNAKSASGMIGYQRLKQQLAAREKSLEEFREEFRVEAQEALQVEYQAAQEQRLLELQASINDKQTMREQLIQRLESERQVTGSSQADLVDLEFARQELERQEDVFDKIGARIVAIQTEEVAPARVDQVDPPKAPLVPDGNPLRLLLMAGVAGFFLPLAIVTAWEFLAQRVTDSSSVRQQDLEVVGEVAMLPRYLPNSTDASSNGESQQMTLFQESVDHLCTTMRLSKDFQDKQVIAIASAISGEGKTHVSIQLAISLARSCKEPVLLVETDLRAPNMPDLMGIDSPVGLLDVLTGKMELKDAIYPDADKHLDVLASGERRRNLHSILDIRVIESIFAELRKKYRYIVLDTPPVLGAGEAMLFTSQADMTLICARRGYSRMSQVRETYERLARTASNPAGVILNGTPRHQYLYSYGSYYGHS